MKTTPVEITSSSSQCIDKIMNWCNSEKPQTRWNIFLKVVLKDTDNFELPDYYSRPSRGPLLCVAALEFDFTSSPKETVVENLNRAFEWVSERADAQIQTIRLPEMHENAWNVLLAHQGIYDDSLQKLETLVKNDYEMGYLKAIMEKNNVVEVLTIHSKVASRDIDLLFTKAKRLQTINLCAISSDKIIPNPYMVSFQASFTFRKHGQQHHRLNVHCNLKGGLCYAKDHDHDISLGSVSFRYKKAKRNSYLMMDLLMTSKEIFAAEPPRGIGSSLVAALLFIASKLGVTLAWASSYTAKGFYEKLNFNPLPHDKAIDMGILSNQPNAQTGFTADKTQLEDLMKQTQLEFKGKMRQLKADNINQ